MKINELIRTKCPNCDRIMQLGVEEYDIWRRCGKCGYMTITCKPAIKQLISEERKKRLGIELYKKLLNNGIINY